jgi:hypothetical protein
MDRFFDGCAWRNTVMFDGAGGLRGTEGRGVTIGGTRMIDVLICLFS